MFWEIFVGVIEKSGELCAIIATVGVCAIATKMSMLLKNDLAMLRSQLKKLSKELLKQGFVTSEEAIEYDALYDCYRKMGGNSFIVELAERVHKLPLKDE